MANWRELPNELRLEIINYLDSHLDILNALSVSRQFRTILEPRLYNSPRIGGYGSRDWVYNSFAQIRRFVRTIVTRPELGLLVKSLFISLHPHDRPQRFTFDSAGEVRACNEILDAANDEIMETSFSETMLAVLQIGIRNSTTERNSDSDKDHKAVMAAHAREDLRVLSIAATAKGLPNGLILNGGCRGQLVFLLQHLPNLENLTVRALNDIETVALACVGSFHGGIPVGLRSIKHLMLIYNDAEVCLLGHLQ